MIFSSNSEENEIPETDSPHPTTLITGAFEQADLQNRVSRISDKTDMIVDGLGLIHLAVLTLNEDLVKIKNLLKGEEA